MSASPRPTFEGPTHIRYEQATRHVWGDHTSGEVIDWIYVSSNKIHQLVFALPSGGTFRHSDTHRTVFAADELYYVLSGTLVISNPETGEAHPVKAGESIFFQRDTWHHGFNYGTEPLRVLEFFAPPPSQGTSSAYAKTKPNVTSPKYTQDELLGHWPKMSSASRETCHNEAGARTRFVLAPGRARPASSGRTSREHGSTYRGQNRTSPRTTNRGTDSWR